MASKKKATHQSSHDTELIRLQAENHELRAQIQSMTTKFHFFELLETNFPDVIWALDLKLNRTYISPSVLKQRGVAPDQAIKTPLEAIMTPESIQIIKTHLVERMIQSAWNPETVETPQTFELEMIHSSGHPIQCEVTAIFDLDATQQPVGLLGITRDISNRKKAEAALLESEERYRVLFMDTLESLSLVQHGTIIDVNATWLRLHGYKSKDDVIGKPVIAFIHPLDHEAFLLRRFIPNDTRNPRVFKIRDQKSDGSPVWVEVLSNTIYLKNQLTIFSAIRDISEKIKADEQIEESRRHLAQKAAELEVVNEELTRYSYAVSHELKNPLRAIKNYSTFLREELTQPLSGKADLYFTEMDRAITESRQMIESILELSNVGQYRLNIEQIDLHTFFQQLVFSIDQTNVELRLPEDWPVFFSEKILLMQIFANLIQNAIKFNTSIPKKVELSWKQCSNHTIEFTVIDNGISIPERCFSKIFLAFERLNSRSEFEGSGMGLAIVKKAVTKLGGTIEVSSRQGIGSVFTICLPHNRQERS